MKEITVSAKTLDDAITEASIQLGVSSDQMEYDVIEKGSTGFFGIGSKQAVIKARLKKEKKEQEETLSVSEIFESKPEVKKEVKAEENKEFKKENKKEYKKDFKKDSKKEYNRDHKKEYKKDSRKEFKKDFKKDNKKEEPKKESAPVQEVKNEAPVAERKEIEVAVVTEETKTICEEFLHDVLKAMGMGEVEFTSEVDEDGALAIEMKGEDMGILIGKRGQTLDSLQYLTNRVANKSQEGYVRVKLDTEDYRRRRKQTLENLAKNIAYKVKRTRKPVSLEPMNPYERRIIHSALQNDERVSTHSEGEEPYRRVVVTPNRR
ncbi:MAG: RNA-binding cell elongation regulator Jag/EloR [Bariatricus sp.]|nr:RNA-binding cell elongation regulator Jag/EloR [Bariatricus sp.]